MADELEVRFATGPAVGFVGPRVAGLVVTDSRSALLQELWRAADGGGGLDDLVEVLMAAGPRQLPAFGLASLESAGLRVLVRGEVAAGFDPTETGRVITVTGDRVHTWVEHVEERAAAVHLHLADDLSELGPFEARRAIFPAARLAVVSAARSSGDADVPLARAGYAVHPVADPLEEALPPVEQPVEQPVESPAASAWPDAAVPASWPPATGLFAAPVVDPVVEPVPVDDPAEADGTAGSLQPVDEPAPVGNGWPVEEQPGDDGALVSDDPAVEGVWPVDDVAMAAEPVDVVDAPADEVAGPSAEVDLDGVVAEPDGTPVFDGALVADQVPPADLAPPADQAPVADEAPVAAETLAAEILAGVDPFPSTPTQTFSDDWSALQGDVAETPEDPGQPLAPEPVSPPALDMPPPSDPAPLVGVPPAPDAAEGSVDSYDHLFGATQYRTVEDAAVREDEPEEPQEPAALVEGVPGGPPPGAPTTGLFGSVPPPPAAPAGDHDGMTITLADLRATQPDGPPPGSAPPPSAPVPAGPMVHAVRCRGGHLNPPHAGACRVCGQPIDDQEPVTVPRPVLGTLRFTDGRVVELHGPVLMGRNPKLASAAVGEAPELVTVPSPLKEVSGTHLEIRVEGWQVLVVDCQSTNGTVLRLPGREPQRLRPAEPFPITPGTSVNLADEAEFTFEASP